MGLATIAAGQYTATFDGTDLGICTLDGKSLQYRVHGRVVNDTDAYGQTPIETIYQGMTCRLVVTFKEYNAGVKKTLWPYSTASAFNGNVGLIGQLASDLAKVLILTALASTPAATTGPATVTANKCILSPENDVRIKFAPDERDIPMVFDLMPYDKGGSVIGFFALT